MMVHRIHPRYIAAEGIVNGRYVLEVRCNPDPYIGHEAGTLVCERAPWGTDWSLTVTRLGQCFMDVGVWTPRV